MSDVGGVPAGKGFKCSECGAFNRVPKKGLPVPVLAAAGGALVVLVVVIAVVFSGRDGGTGNRTESGKGTLERDKASPRRDEATRKPDEATRKPDEATRKPDKPARKAENPAPEPVDTRLARLARAAMAEGATAEDAFKVAEYCEKKRGKKYRTEMKKWAELTIERNPRHEWAHEMLDHVEFLGEYISEEEKEKRLEDPWYEKAVEVREKKFLQDQDLRDLGLVYHASMPFVIAKQRNDDRPLRDKWELRELGAILSGTYHRFYELFGSRFKLTPFDGSRGEAKAIPIFWFDSRQKFWWAMRRLKGVKRDISQFAAAFYASSERDEPGRRMIYGYYDRNRRDRTFDLGKVAHEATHAIEDFFRKARGRFEDRVASGSWWFSEGLAEFIGSVEVKASRNAQDSSRRTFDVKFLNRNWARIDMAKLVDGQFIFRAKYDDEQHIGFINGYTREECDPRDWPFDLRDLIDLRHGGDLDARAAVMFPASDPMGRRNAQRMRGIVGSLAYFEAWALVTFLYESGGEYREALMRCFAARRQNKSHKVVTQVTFKNIDLGKLEKEWLAWIKTVLKEKR
jgi:hypothetical protein